MDGIGRIGGAWRARTVALLGLALLAGRVEGEAQEARLGIFAGRVLDERGDAPSGVTISPSLSWSGSAASVGLAGQATRFGGGALLGSAGAWARTERVVLSALSVGAEGEWWLTGSSTGYREGTAALRPRARLRRGAWEVETGPNVAMGAVEMPGLAAVREEGSGLFGAPLERTAPGESRTRVERGWGAAGAMERGPLALRAGWRGSAADQARWTEWTLDGSLSLGRVQVGASTGTRVGDLREAWAAGRMMLDLGSHATLVGEAGRSPSHPLTGRPAGSYASLGLSLSTAAVAAPRAAPPLAAGGDRIALRARPGARVELYADWNGWRAEPVPEVAPGRFEAPVWLEPGSYRFAVRVDGVWRAPDGQGFALEDDGYGGTNAVIRVARRD